MICTPCYPTDSALFVLPLWYAEKKEKDYTLYQRGKDMELNRSEIQDFQSVAKGNASLEEAASALDENDGDLGAAFDQLWGTKFGVQDFGDRKSFFQIALDVLREEICGDKGFRAQLEAWKKDPKSATMLTGAVVYLSNLAHVKGLPLDSTLSTVFILYLSRLSLDTFCQYLQQQPKE
jgi:hypothetical protein